MNPLLNKFETNYESVPFSIIKPEHFIPALKEAIEEAKNNIEKIKSNSQAANFENTFVELEFSDMRLSRISDIFFNIHGAETNDEIKEIAKEFSPLLSAYSNDVILDNGLFERIKSAYENLNQSSLSKEQLRLAEKTFKSFKRNGALCSESEKERIREIDEKLAKLRLSYEDNVLTSINNYELVIDDERELKGLPDSFKQAAKELATKKGKNGWMFTLQAPSYLPVLRFCENRELREKIVRESGKVGYKGDNNNFENIKGILELRNERAKLLGYESHADFILEERMAESKAKVFDFLDNLRQVAMPFAKKDLEQVTDFAKSIGGPSELMKWDYHFYLEKLKKEKFDFDEEKVRPYFKLENVLEGAFLTAEKLFGIKFEEINDIDTYHEEVTTYKVEDKDGSFVGLFYTDFFPRDGKRSGAWMTDYRPQFIKDDTEYRPHVAIVCNFSRPTSKTPSLLNFREVTTLFHEFGHALHGLLSNCSYPSTSGTNVHWDFVELPSQVMENWVYEKECLDLFAKHYETSDPIPFDMIEKIKSVGVFHEAIATMRQISFADIDMFWHTTDPSQIEDLNKEEKKVFAKTDLFPPIEDSNFSCAFSHIFAGGYSAGYYSYKWAEVLDADAFEYFKENGIFNEEIGAKFRNEVLSRGGTEAPMELYKRFRGQEPDVKALLRRAGMN